MINFLLSLSITQAVSSEPAQTKAPDQIVFARITERSIGIKEVLEAWQSPEKELRLKELKLETLANGETVFVWEKSLFDSEASAQRVDLWKKIAQGQLKPGDLIDLEGSFGAISQSQESLKKNYGLTAENCGGVNAVVGISRTVTLEDAAGNRIEIRITETPPSQATGLKEVDKAKLLAERKPEEDVTFSPDLKFQFFGLEDGGLSRIRAVNLLTTHLYQSMANEYESLQQSVNQFEQYMSGEKPGLTKGGTALSENEQRLLDEKIRMRSGGQKGLSDYKVVDSQASPFLGVKFDVTDSSEPHKEIPMLQLDRPKAPSKQLKP